MKRFHHKAGTSAGGARTGLVAGLVLLAVLCLYVLLGPSRFLAPTGEPFGRDRPVGRVILVIVDTLRPDVLSCYGSGEVPTPNIDRLAREGIRFTNAFSTGPWTLPAVSSIMTGLSPMVHGAVQPDSKLPGSIDTLAEVMRDAGYLTAAIGSNIFLKPDYNLSQGFREYDFYPRPSGDGDLSDVSTADLTKKAIDWLEAHREDDFFLWIHYFDPHLPYEPAPDALPPGPVPDRIGARFEEVDEIRNGELDPTGREKEWIRALYVREVAYVDENLGAFFGALEKLGLYDDTLIVFMSDHGEEFWEHGGFEHGHTLYNELLEVPLIIKLPGAVSTGERSAMVSIQGVMPTVLDLCGIDPGEELAAHSLTPLLERDSEDAVALPIVSTGLLYGEEGESIIVDGMKYIRFPGTERDELYLLGDDPGERSSASLSSPDLVLKTAHLLDDCREIAEIGRTRYGTEEMESVEIDPETRQWLESLGYLR